MKANRSLSEQLTSEQFATLATVLTFLEGLTTHLDTVNRATSDVDAEITFALQDLGRLCVSKLLADFPDLAVWRALGDGGAS